MILVTKLHFFSCKKIISATAAGLTTGTATYTIYPAKNVTVSAQRATVAAPSVSALNAQIGIFGNAIRYYIGKQASVSIEIMNASGRVLQRILHPKQSEGWHPLQLGRTPDNAGAFGNGVFFIRLSADGKNQCVKRFMFVR